jgi:hypothetical protein
MQPKLIVTLERFGDADLLAKADLILASLRGNAHFPEPWPAQVPSLTQIRDALGAYRSAYHASQTNDSLKIKQREATHDALVELLKRLAPYLELIAQGDTNVLATTGYDLRRDIVRGVNCGKLPAPSNVNIEHGPDSGTLQVSVRRVPGARSYEMQIAQGDPNVEANWKHAVSSGNSTHIRLYQKRFPILVAPDDLA